MSAEVKKDCPHSWDLWRPIHYQFDLMQPNQPLYMRKCQNMGCAAYQTVMDLAPCGEPETKEKV